MGNKTIAAYMNEIMKCNTEPELKGVILKAVNEDDELVNGHEDFDFLLIAVRYRRIKLGLLDYNPITFGCETTLGGGI